MLSVTAMQPYEEMGELELGESSNPTLNEVEESKFELGFSGCCHVSQLAEKMMDKFNVHMATQECFWLTEIY